MLTHLNLLSAELDKPFVFLVRGRVIERKPQYQRVRDCGESESQQDESSGEKITRWIELNTHSIEGRLPQGHQHGRKRKEESLRRDMF